MTDNAMNPKKAGDPINYMRALVAQIPENRENSLSMLNMIRGGANTALNWLDAAGEAANAMRETPSSEPVMISDMDLPAQRSKVTWGDMYAPLGAAAMAGPFVKGLGNAGRRFAEEGFHGTSGLEGDSLRTPFYFGPEGKASNYLPLEKNDAAEFVQGGAMYPIRADTRNYMHVQENGLLDWVENNYGRDAIFKIARMMGKDGVHWGSEAAALNPATVRSATTGERLFAGDGR